MSSKRVDRPCVNGCGRNGYIPIMMRVPDARDRWAVACWVCGYCKARFAGEYEMVLVPDSDLEAWKGRL